MTFVDTTSTPYTAAELVIQDAIIRQAFSDETQYTLQLSCQRGFAVVNLQPEQLRSVMDELSISSLDDLPGQRILTYLDAARVVGIGAR